MTVHGFFAISEDRCIVETICGGERKDAKKRCVCRERERQRGGHCRHKERPKTAEGPGGAEAEHKQYLEQWANESVIMGLRAVNVL